MVKTRHWQRVGALTRKNTQAKAAWLHPNGNACKAGRHNRLL